MKYYNALTNLQSILFIILNIFYIGVISPGLSVPLQVPGQTHADLTSNYWPRLQLLRSLLQEISCEYVKYSLILLYLSDGLKMYLSHFKGPLRQLLEGHAHMENVFNSTKNKSVILIFNSPLCGDNYRAENMTYLQKLVLTEVIVTK